MAALWDMAQWKARWESGREGLTYTGSNVVLSGATFIGSFVCAKLLSPEELGSVQTAMLIIPYLAFMGAGVFNGLNRHFPYLIGQGREEEAVAYARSAESFVKVVCVAAMLAAGIQCLWYVGTGANRWLQVASLGVVFVAGAQQLVPVRNSVAVGRRRFFDLSRINLVNAVTGLVMLIAIWRFGVIGQCVRLGVIGLVCWMMLRRLSSDVSGWDWNWGRLKALAAIGLPVFFIGYLHGILLVADRTLVAWARGPEAVGYYALAGLVFVAMQSVYLPLGIMTYSNANRRYGETGELASLQPYVFRLLGLIAVTIIPMAAVIYWALPVVIPAILPKYVEGIRAAQIVALSGVASAFCSTAFVFNTVRRNSPYGVMMAVALGLFLIAGLATDPEDMTLERVAWIRVAITVMLALGCNSLLVFLFILAAKRRREKSS